MNKTITTFYLQHNRSIDTAAGGDIIASTGFDADETPLTLLGFVEHPATVGATADVSARFALNRDPNLAMELLPIVQAARGRAVLTSKVEGYLTISK